MTIRNEKHTQTWLINLNFFNTKVMGGLWNNGCLERTACKQINKSGETVIKNSCPLKVLYLLINNGTWLFVSCNTWGRLTSPLGRGSLWPVTLGALGQTYGSLTTRFFVNCNTWGRLTGPLGQGSSWTVTRGRLTGPLGQGSSRTATLRADWRVPWDVVLCEPRHLGQTDRSLGTRFFAKSNT